MNRAEEHLRQNCEALRDVPHKFHRWLAIGAAPSMEPLTEDEESLVREARRAVRPRARSCYENCQKTVLLFDEFRYVEGYVGIPRIPLAVEHAWLTLDGKLVEITPNHDDASDYFGVEIDAQLVSEFQLEAKVYGPLTNDYMLDWKYAQQIFGALRA